MIKCGEFGLFRALSRGMLALIAFAGLAMAALSSGAFAQGTPCAPRADVLALAAAQWHEAPVLTAPAAQGKLVFEFLVSANRTWTALLVRPDDVACVIASGTDLMQSGDIPLTGERM